MTMLQQRTIRHAISAKGVGVHSGRSVAITLRPAEVDTGLVFRVHDAAQQGSHVDMPALAAYVTDTRLCTTLQRQGVRLSTVEHLMSAVAGLGIDNLLVEIDAAELPILDGSASPFVFLLQGAGLLEQQAEKRMIRVREPVKVQDGDRVAELLPYDGFRLRFTIDYDHPAFTESNQTVCVDFSSAAFIRHISRARTFGFLADLDQLRALKLGQGGSLDNTVVLDDQGVMNPEGLRYRDEFVRHKVLDAIGDLYLLGHQVIGEYKGYKAGHTMNFALVEALLSQPHAWEWVTYDRDHCPLVFSTLSKAHRAA